MPRRPNGIRSPRALEREYIRLLTDRILRPLFIDLQARVAGATSAAEVDRAVEEATAAAEARGVPVESVRAQLNRLSAYHRARVIQTMISALGVDVGPMLTEPAVNAFMTRVVERNVDLIKTIPPRFHDSMKDRLSAELRDQPFDRERLTQLLAREYGSTGYNLRRLARDQTTKTIGGLTEIRQRQLGIQGYRWSSSADERVRPTHAANNGRFFRWDSPPAATGHPGTDIQCRCVAIPAVLKADRERLGAKPTTARRKPRKDTPASRRRSAWKRSGRDSAAIRSFGSGMKCVPLHNRQTHPFVRHIRNTTHLPFGRPRSQRCPARNGHAPLTCTMPPFIG